MVNKKPFFVLLILAALFMSLFYGKVIVSPNNFVFENNGDAIKNYYTYAYHIANDSSYTNFEGMNYPYGEHFIYTDCHPILANSFKFSANYFTVFETHNVGILNFLMILSIFLTFIVVYFLLLEFSIHKWISVFFSISITLLAPQIFRLGGHLALSYSIAIPLSWLLLIKVFKTPKKRLVFTLIVNNIFWMFIHAYLGIIILFFLTLLIVVKVLSDKNRKQKIKNYAYFLATILIPILLFYGFTKLTDNHLGRTNNPSGFFLYNAEFDDVFLPNHKPLKPVFDYVSNNNLKQEWEAWSYIGISATLMCLVFIITLFLWRFNKNKREKLKIYFANKYLNISLIAAFLVLLFAMAFPFKQFPQLLDFLPVLKQFRATGRFTWPFYFVFLTFSAYIFNGVYLHFRSKEKRNFGVLIIVIITFFNVIEALPYHIETSNNITVHANVFNKELLAKQYKDALSNIDVNNYQAIIALPFYHQGSETFSRTRNDEAVRASIILSYHTKLPMVNANLTRVSVDESKNIVQLIFPDFYDKKLKHDIKNSKPFLIVKVNEELTRYETDLYNKATSFLKQENIELLTITPENLFKTNSDRLKYNFELIKDSLKSKEGFHTLDTNSFIYYNDYEKSPSEFCFRGKGAFKGIKKGKNIFTEFNPNTFIKDKEYQLSMWMHNGEKDALNLWLRVIVEEYNSDNNEWYTTTFFPEFSETIYGDWSLVEGVFKVHNPKNKVYIVSKGKENSKANLYTDDLLIREVNNDVYKWNNDILFYNNHQIK